MPDFSPPGRTGISKNFLILDAELNLLAECSAGKFSMTNINSAINS
jgi:hypothetical protein